MAKILVVDDDAGNLRVAVAVLEKPIRHKEFLARVAVLLAGKVE